MKLNVTIMSIALLIICICIAPSTANLSNISISQNNTSSSLGIAVNQDTNQTIQTTIVPTIKTSAIDTFSGSSYSGANVTVTTSAPTRLEKPILHITSPKAYYSSPPSESPEIFQATGGLKISSGKHTPLIDKNNLTTSQKKLTTSLLLVSDPSIQVASLNNNEIQLSLITRTVPVNIETQGLRSIEGASVSGLLVYVYISMNPGYSTHYIDPYVAEVTDRDEENSLAVAWVDSNNLSTITSLKGVRSIEEVLPPVVNIGSVTTQGNVIHKTSDVRSQYGYGGAGMKIGIISTGVNNIASSKASGDLPADVTVLSNTNPLNLVVNDEGTAMLEIVHDMVPDAKLYFHDCGSNTLAFNDAINELQANGCTIICDDIGWYNEPYFEDGIIASNVATLLADHPIIYVSSAGNSAQEHYQGDFVDDGYGYHNKYLYAHMPTGSAVRVFLQWNDQFAHSANDYDLLLNDYSTGVLLSYSANSQTGTQNPYEYLNYANSGSSRDVVIRIGKYSGAAKTLELFILPQNGAGVYSDNVVESDSIFGHPAVPDVIAVAAVPASSPSTIEYFSSQGPVTISYPSPEIRQKPDISGVDGVAVTGAGGFSNPFYGTSASAPHIAAVVAQIWGANPSLTSAQVRNALYTSAVDLGTPGKDTTFGNGRADALAMLVYTSPTPTITSISPANGPATGGTAVTITGTGFISASTVTFGTVGASVRYNSATSLTATSPAGTGTVDIRVTTPGGTSAIVAEDTFTYLPVPTINSISPANGPVAGGTAVTITGTGFTGTTAVKFGTTPGTNLQVTDDTTLIVTSPARAASTVDIRVTTPGGTSTIVTADKFTYLPAPTVSRISPANGPVTGGTAVTITGSRFTSASTVTFGTIAAATVTYNSATSITATSPAGTGTVDIRVTTSGGTSANVSADRFTYYEIPAITSISPANGLAAGGTAVTVTGAGFTSASTVMFGTIAAASVTYNSATSITATSPAGAGTVDIRVTTLGGTSPITQPADQFTYAPTVSGILPANGPAAGGTAVTITGTGFTGATAVTFGTTPATDLQVTDDTTLTVTSPAGTGTVDVQVTTPSGTSPITQPADQFTYAPTVTSISPENGPAAGGTTVTITGTGFTSASTVTFGTQAASVTYNSATSLTAISPAGTGTVDIRVTTPSGTSAIVAEDMFTYVPVPTVTSISPANGPITGGTAVTITGTGFTGATTVTFGTMFGTTPGTGLHVTNDTTLTVTSPARAAGTIDIRVTTPGGTSAIVTGDKFIYLPAPTVTRISPANGPAAGGTAVTVTGTGFTSASTVTFGTIAAASVTYNSATSLTATSPAGTGTVDIRVTTTSGTSANVTGDKFTYYEIPTVTSISPANGPAAGGTAVTITGTGFTSASTVKFGIIAASVKYNSATSLTATSPAGAGTVDIRVTTLGGTSSISQPADQFIYAPTVTSISPANGSAAGGTTVTITGTGFTGATAVTFGTTPGTDVQVTNDNSLTVTSPAGTGSVDVQVTTPGGTSPVTQPADQFTYAPTVTGISPANGPVAGGTAVTITGTGFTNTSTVTFGTVAASVRYNSATNLTATSPAGTGTVDVRVTTPGGTSAIVAEDTFTYVPVPTITSISPANGPVAGGTMVTITGTGFTGATAVTFGTTFGTTPGTDLHVTDDTSLTIISPARAAGTVDIRVTTPGGTSATVAGDKFIYLPAPTVTRISPANGPVVGGTAVTITGTRFTSASTVTFGTIAAASVTYNSATSLTATSPAGTGIVDIRVSTPSGTSAIVAGDKFTYYEIPTVNSISPANGPAAGGTAVTITGTWFTSASTVRFGTVAASVRYNSATSLTATSPAGAGTVDVRVTTLGGTSPISQPADQFTYAPTVTSISPANGPVAGGTAVTITGTGFTGATSVIFGTISGTDVQVTNDNTLTVTSPAGTGSVDVQVTTPGGTSPVIQPADQFTYAPTMTGITPVSGPATGGTAVTITGTGFTNTSTVTFGTVAASVRYNSATSLTATSPAGTGTVDVRVTTPSGTSAIVAEDMFMFVPVPTVTSISPANGPVAGGTAVTITGTGFTGATAVKFGTIPGIDLHVTDDTTLTVTSPARAAGTVDIRVTTPGGTSAIVTADKFIYLPAPTVFKLSPVSGPAAGGTTVTITGTGFTSASIVTFGTIAAASVTYNSATNLTTTSPPGTGRVDVRVTTPSGTSATTFWDQFTYNA